MARHVDVSCPAGQPTELSNAENIGGLSTIILNSDGDVAIIGTIDGTPPADPNNSIILREIGDGWVGKNLSTVFPGATVVRLWAWPFSGTAEVFVSYADA